MTVYIAFLRGVNVGGKSRIIMKELKEAMDGLGFANVQTYIQSGNVLFASDKDESELRPLIEQEIEKSFGLAIPVILRTVAELKKIVAGLPFPEAGGSCGEVGGANDRAQLENDQQAITLADDMRIRCL
jgi:uncharacterized protein (DUF1697 family)